jgi:hypothetical protein
MLHFCSMAADTEVQVHGLCTLGAGCNTTDTQHSMTVSGIACVASLPPLSWALLRHGSDIFNGQSVGVNYPFVVIVHGEFRPIIKMADMDLAKPY